MGNARNLADGETRYLNASGDATTGNLGVGGAANGTYAITSHSSGGANLRLENDGEVGFIRLEDDGDLNIWAHGDENISFLTGTGSGTTRMNIDGSGRVTMPNQPAMSGRAIRPVDTGGYVTTGVNLYVDGGANLEVNNGNHWNNSTGVWTCPVAGRYFCYAAFLIDDNQGAASLARYGFKKNGSEFYISYNHDKYGSSYGGMATAGGIFNCAANDTITCVASHGKFHAGGESSMTIYLLN